MRTVIQDLLFLSKFSFGLNIEELKRTNERGIQLDAIHLRGVGNISTADVFKHFKEFGAASVEWIDNESCEFVEILTLYHMSKHLDK